MPYDAPHPVNVAECLDLADFLDRLELEKFDISAVVREDDDCGTVACIYGWQSIRKNRDPYKTGAYGAMRADLGISEEQLNDLTMSPGWLDDVYRTTPQQCATVLRHLAATGIVDYGILS